jgi:hypothetical protein
MRNAIDTLTEWKVFYDALESAQDALAHALDTSAPNQDIAELRARVQRLRRRSDFVLDKLNAELAALRCAQEPH